MLVIYMTGGNIEVEVGGHCKRRSRVAEDMERTNGQLKMKTLRSEFRALALSHRRAPFNLPLKPTENFLSALINILNLLTC